MGSFAFIGDDGCTVGTGRTTISLSGSALTNPVTHRTHAAALTAGDLVDGGRYRWTVYKSDGNYSTIIGAFNDGTPDTISDITWEDEVGTISATDSVALVLLGSSLSAVRLVQLSGSGTYTKPDDVKELYVAILGSVGGRLSAAVGGVGGPGYAEKYYASPAASYSFAVGAAGTASGTDGGTSTFDTVSVTGSAGVTTATGGAGGVGSGGDFNATGGTGGDGYSTTYGGGGGGAATRAGNGGSGAAATATDPGAGGGTGGNNASGTTPGAAATTAHANAIDWPKIMGMDNEIWNAGSAVGASAGGNGARASFNNGNLIPWIGVTTGNPGGGGNPANAAGGYGAYIFVLEVI